MSWVKRHMLLLCLKRVSVLLIIFSLILQNLIFTLSPVYAASSPWTQTDWSGGSGQTSWSDATKYDSASNVTTSTAGQATLTNTEELSNTGFESDLTSWSEVPSYTLNDQFTTDRAAGAVNGTSAEPTGGTRTVTDTNSKLSLASGVANFATGGVGAGNPGLWYGSQVRALGRIILGRVVQSSAVASSQSGLGWDTAQSGPLDTSLGFSAGSLVPRFAGTSGPAVGSFSAGTVYDIAVVLRAAGAFYFIKGGLFTTWTLLWIATTGTDATLFPAVEALGTISVFTADNIRIPAVTWVLNPLAYDTFTRSDGAVGSSETTGPDSQTTSSLVWTGGAIATNKNVITPTLGSELVTNPGLEGTYVGGVAPSWTANTGISFAEDTVTPHGGTSAQKYITDTEASILRQAVTTVVGTWYRFSGWLKTPSRTAGIGFVGGLVPRTNSTSYVNVIGAGRATATSTNFDIRNSSSPGTAWFADDVSAKPLTLSSLFSTVPTSDSDVIADVNVTLAESNLELFSQAGLVTNLDSTSSPSNFLIAYHDGTNVMLDKNVGGTYTNLISAAATYSAGATLRVITYHSDATTLKVRVYYNNALVGSEQTVTDAGIRENTLHGLFSTYSGNSFDNFTLWARGTGAEYTSAPFEELTAIRDTVTTYSSTAGSAKLVAGGTDANFLQSVNVGDTNTYNLSAYAYTDGSAVTASDLALYYDTATIATTYTSVGGGWYQLTGTVTGAASAKNYGVRVKAGKTVYLDNASLNNYTSGTLTSSIFDSGQGSNWGTLTYSATTPTNTSIAVKARSSNDSGMSGATAFAACTAITSGTDISSNTCITDTHRYIQYELTLANSSTEVTPTFSDISTTFEVSDATGPVLELDSLGDNSYTNSERPTFRWKQATDAISSVSDYDLTIDNPSLGSSQPSGDFTISDIPVSRTSDYETNKYTVHYDGFSDSDSDNNYISVYTRSTSSGQANSWGESENDGKLREGKVNWKVRATDSVGNYTEASRNLFVDKTGPKVEFTQINGTPFTTNSFSTTDRTPTLYGKNTDPLAGGDTSITQDENGPRVASGPKQVEIKIEKKNGLLYDLHTLYTINMDKPWYTCDNTEVTNNTKQRCDKYLPFEYTSSNALDFGTYKITLTGKDKADNASNENSFILSVTTLGKIVTSEENKTIEKEINELPEEEQEQAREAVEITKPVEPGFLEKLGELIAQISKSILSLAGNLAKATAKSLVFIADKTGQALTFIGKTNNAILVGVLDGINSVVAFVEQGIGTVANAVAQGASELLALIDQAVANAGDAIGNGYNQLASSAPGVAKTILIGIGNEVSAGVIAITTITDTIETSAITVGQNVGIAIVNTTNALINIPTTAARNTGVAIANLARKGINNTKNGIANFAFAIGEKTDDISHGVGVAFIKIGYLFVPEPTKISSVTATALSATSVKISWTTNHPANGKVNWGYQEGIYDFEQQTDKRTAEHEFILENLTPNTEYHYEVMSQNRNYVYDASRKFKTPEE